jgi:hypothetical protein
VYRRKSPEGLVPDSHEYLRRGGLGGAPETGVADAERAGNFFVAPLAIPKDTEIANRRAVLARGVE